MSVAARAALLADSLPTAIVTREVPLRTIARWRIGGPARVLVEPRSAIELAEVLDAAARFDVPWIVIGDASNLLFDDRGLDGVVIRMGAAFTHLALGADGAVSAGAGLWVPCFVRRVLAAGLAGATHAIGIPGRLGGLIVMNGGSQRRAIGDHLVSVDVLDPSQGVRRIPAADLGLGYRTSVLQDSGFIVLGATFRFPPGDAAALHREAVAILAERRRKFPRDRANCGSVFVSDPALYERMGPPGAAIERVGLKGHRNGEAQISPQHGNFIVNTGHARSHDVLRLIKLARDKVAHATGIEMKAEVRHVSVTGEIRPAHLAAAAIDGDGQA